MQENNSNKKEILLKALAKTLKELGGDKSQFMFASENDISVSIISTIEKGVKDPQLSTVFRLAEASNISVIAFMQKLLENLPKDFSFLEK